MKRWLGCTCLLGSLLLEGGARAQSSLDMLEKDLNQVKQEHQEASTQNTENFLTALQNAGASADAALTLYQQAGGDMPDATKVTTQYEHETPSEKAVREAKDQAKLSNLGNMAQLHCNLMRFAALFIVKPDEPTLHDQWIAWLKNGAAVYPQLTGAHDLRDTSMKDSVIGKYLGFTGWGDKEQGQWSVKQLPKFYRENVLDPMRHPPTADTLAAWDVYIAMKNADQGDADTWNNVEYPSLQFERDADDFQSAPGTDKIEALVAIIKANPKHPKIDEWFSRVHDMIEAYRAQKAGGAPAGGTNDTSTPATNAAPTADTNAVPAPAPTSPAPPPAPTPSP